MFVQCMCPVCTLHAYAVNPTINPPKTPNHLCTSVQQGKARRAIGEIFCDIQAKTSMHL